MPLRHWMRVGATSCVMAATACSDGPPTTTGTPPVDEDAVTTSTRCRQAFDVSLACTDCIEAHCCAEAIRCSEDFACKPCILRGDQTSCDNPPPEAAEAMTACMKEHCVDVCRPPQLRMTGEPACMPPTSPPSEGDCVIVGAPLSPCNPVTNTGCGGGEACYVSDHGFKCESLGNVNGLCEPCGYGQLDYCLTGLHCIGRCSNYCCEDADCGPGGFCDTQQIENIFFGEPPAAGLGVCKAAP